MDKKANELVKQFLIISTKYIGKEILLPSSDQPFSIDFIKDDKKPRYRIQYGWPQSGCVCVSFIVGGENENTICDLLVTAPSSDKSFVSATYDEEEELDVGIDVRISHGINMGFDSHKDFDSIQANPNAIDMLETAIQDLSVAIILGESHEDALKDSREIPSGRSK